MMVTVASDVSIAPIVEALMKKNVSLADKVKTYQQFTGYMKESSGEIFDGIVLEIQQHLNEILEAISKDISGPAPEVAHVALQTLGFCLYQDDVSKALGEEQTLQIIKTLCNTIVNTTDKTTCTRTLWCISKQALNGTVIEKELEKILEAIEHGQCKKNFQSMTVEHEALNAVIRLLQQVPDKMKLYAKRWGRLIYPLVVHSAPRLRERAMIAMEAGMEAMLEQQEEIVQQLVPDLKALLIAEMTKLMATKHEVFVLKVWRCYIKLLGKALHHGSLINHLLPIVEQGFKNQSSDVKCAAYQCWQALIDNFSLNQDIVCDHKRVKLVMQVFKINNAKYENVALEKLRVWWHFLQKTADKNHVFFEQVCVPLLQFAVSGSVGTSVLTPGKPTSKTPVLQRIGSASFASPVTPQINPATPGGSTPITFRSVQMLGTEVLAHVLGKWGDNAQHHKHSFTLDPLKHDIIHGPTSFIKHSAVLITAVKQCIVNLGEHIDDSILFHIWHALFGHVKNALDICSKKDTAEMFKYYLECFGDVVESQSLPPATLLKLLQPIANLAAKILSSSTFHVGASSDVMQGCPALYLLGLLFHHRIMEISVTNEMFFTLLATLMSCGFTNDAAVLEFSGCAITSLHAAAPLAESADGLWRMWSTIVNPLQQHILKSQEVNQGNILEHDFSCMYSVLEFPVKFLLTSNLSAPTTKSLLKSWNEFYLTFARLAALVTNAEGNICCEELCARMLDINLESKLQDVTFLDSCTHMCQCMVNAVDFSAFSNASQFINPLSPSKFTLKKKDHALGNLHSLSMLAAKLVESLQHVKSQKMSSLQSLAVCIVGTVEVLFSHVPTSNMVHSLTILMAPHLAQVLHAANSRATNKLYSAQVLAKVEQLWAAIVTCLQSRYSGPFDSEFLEKLSPLLETTFLHSRRPIKNQTLSLWNATFAHGPPLEYPQKLKSVLSSVKEKSPIQLPGWTSSDVVLVGETPSISQGTQGESQVPLPNFTGFRSPVKSIGSFLNKAVSPDIRKSPLVKSSPANLKDKGGPGSAKKKLSLGQFKNEDFVVISSPPRRGKRALTEHQKDKMREQRRAGVPAMYSSVEVSQDTSMMAAQFNTDTQTQMNDSDSSSTPHIQVTPFPFFKAAKKQAEEPKATSPVRKKSSEKPVDKMQSIEETSPERIGTKSKRRKSVRFSDSDTDNDLKKTEKSDIIDSTSKDPSPKSTESSDCTVVSMEHDSVIEVADSSEKPKIIGSIIVINDSQNKNAESVGKIDLQSISLFETETEKTHILTEETQDTSEKIHTYETDMSEESASLTPKRKQLKLSDILTPSSQAKSSSSSNERPPDSSNAEVNADPNKSESIKSSQPNVRKARSKTVDSPLRKTRSSSSNSPLRAQSKSTQSNNDNTKEPKIPSFLEKWANDAKAISEKSLPTTKKEKSFLFDKREDVPTPLSSSAPVIMVEDTQQSSPKENNMSHPPEKSVVIEETPLKDDLDPTIVNAEQAENATKALFSSSSVEVIAETEATQEELLPVVCDKDEAVPQSQVVLFDNSTVEEDMDTSEVSEVSTEGSEVKESKTFSRENIVEARKKVNMKPGISPRIKLHKLTQDDICSLSPRKQAKRRSLDEEMDSAAGKKSIVEDLKSSGIDLPDEVDDLAGIQPICEMSASQESLGFSTQHHTVDGERKNDDKCEPSSLESENFINSDSSGKNENHEKDLIENGQIQDEPNDKIQDEPNDKIQDEPNDKIQDEPKDKVNMLLCNSVTVSQLVASTEPASSESQDKLANGIVPMDFSSEASDAITSPKPKRRSRQPAWMKDHQIESPSRLPSAEEDSNTDNTPKRRGRKRMKRSSVEAEDTADVSGLDTSQDSTDREATSDKYSGRGKKGQSKTKSLLMAAILQPTLESNGSMDSDSDASVKRPRRRSLKLGKKNSDTEKEERESDKEVPKEPVNTKKLLMDAIGQSTMENESSFDTDNSDTSSSKRMVKKKGKAKESNSNKVDGKEHKKDTERIIVNEKKVEVVSVEKITDEEHLKNESICDEKKATKKKDKSLETNKKARIPFTAEDSESVLSKVNIKIGNQSNLITACASSDSEDDIPLTLLGSKVKDSLDLLESKQSEKIMTNDSFNSEDENIPIKSFIQKTEQTELVRKVSNKKKSRKISSSQSFSDGNSDSQSSELEVKSQQETQDCAQSMDLFSAPKDSVTNCSDSVEPDTNCENTAVSLQCSSTPKPRSFIKKSPGRTPKSSSIKKLTSRERLLKINMNTSPTLPKRLRSAGDAVIKSKRSSKVLNRSLDSAIHRMSGKRKRNDSDENTNVDESTEEDKNNNDTVKEVNAVITDNTDKVSEVTNAIDEEELKSIFTEDAVEPTPSTTLNETANTTQATELITVAEAAKTQEISLPVKEIPKKSPTKQSPPKKGKPFDLPETPTSCSNSKGKHAMSRADLILHRSRLLINRKHMTPSPSSIRGRVFKSPARKLDTNLLKTGGILKKSPPENLLSPEKANRLRQDQDKNSPPPSGFRPIHLPRVYSPSASPSAGILKKRRLSGDIALDSPSPPNKQRRVSFAEAAEIRTIASRQKQARPASPRPVNRCLDMPKPQKPSMPQSPLVTKDKVISTTSNDGSVCEVSPIKKEGVFAVPKAVSNSKKIEPSPTQDTCLSTQESQLTCVGPVFPVLVSCLLPVDQILPQLTSSMWMRGLEQLFRSKNIRTVGDLSKLSEYEINQLPIRSPKVQTVKTVLTNFTQSAKINLSVNDKNAGDSKTDTDKEKSAIQPCDRTAEKEHNVSTDLLDDIKKLDDSVCEGDNSISEVSKPNGQTSSTSKTMFKENMALTTILSPKRLDRKALLAQFASLSEQLNSERLETIPSHHLVQIHSHLNTMMSNVVLALKAKCPSSPSISQSSQDTE